MGGKTSLMHDVLLRIPSSFICLECLTAGLIPESVPWRPNELAQTETRESASSHIAQSMRALGFLSTSSLHKNEISRNTLGLPASRQENITVVSNRQFEIASEFPSWPKCLSHINYTCITTTHQCTLSGSHRRTCWAGLWPRPPGKHAHHTE